jgi:hypothetical protein
MNKQAAIIKDIMPTASREDVEEMIDRNTKKTKRFISAINEAHKRTANSKLVFPGPKGEG